MTDKPVTLAAITGAHGVAGEVRLKLFCDSAENLGRHKSFNEGALVLSKVRSDGKGGAIARFAGIGNRGEAEKLRGTVLSVARGELPALADGEYYHADIIGLAVVTNRGEPVGRAIAVHNFGATDIIEIEKHPAPEKGAKTFMVPMIAAAVPEWDEQRLVISSDFAE
ncbi:MAG: ribosome maturation factor RimM [Erythrobacter sp.]